jgi:hypothetical protein
MGKLWFTPSETIIYCINVYLEELPGEQNSTKIMKQTATKTNFQYSKLKTSSGLYTGSRKQLLQWLPLSDQQTMNVAIVQQRHC